MWDYENAFSLNQDLDEGLSDHVVDAGPADLGLGEPVTLQLILNGSASGTLDVFVETADDAVFTEAVELARFRVPASVIQRGGPVLAAPLPTGCRRYLRLRYFGASGGTVTAGLVQGAQTSGLRR